MIQADRRGPELLDLVCGLWAYTRPVAPCYRSGPKLRTYGGGPCRGQSGRGTT